MRFLAVGIVVALTAPVHAADEDKAKEVTAAFLKAVIAQDIDALMKTVDTPFVIDFGKTKAMTFEKPGELKDALVKILDISSPSTVMSFKLGAVYDMPAFAKFAKEKNVPEFAEQAEKLVGKSGYLVMIVGKEGKEGPFVLIRFKDGKAFIASVPK